MHVHPDVHKLAQEKQNLLFLVSIPSSECWFLTGYFAKRKTVPKNQHNMICSYKIIGNEDYKVLVTIQHRRVNNVNNQHWVWREAVQSFCSGPVSGVESHPEKPGNLRTVYFRVVDSFVSHLVKFIYYWYFCRRLKLLFQFVIAPKWFKCTGCSCLKVQLEQNTCFRSKKKKVLGSVFYL